MALCRSTVGFQPLMVPSSVSKMKNALPERSCAVTANCPVPLNTRPVGADGPSAPVGGGIVTTSGIIGPVPLSAIQTGLVALKSIPQALTRLGSSTAAQPGTSETRFVCTYFCAEAMLANARLAIRNSRQARNVERTDAYMAVLLGSAVR